MATNNLAPTPHTQELSFDSEVNHLGVLIGDPSLRRIVALSTANVFIDEYLIPDFWELASSSVDSGFQGHLYTRIGDALVIRIPSSAYPDIEKILTAIDLNHKIWNSFVGVQLSSSENPMTIVSDYELNDSDELPENISWFCGNMMDGSRWLFDSAQFSYLAFIFSTEIVQQLGIYNRLDRISKNIANSTSILMDKNKSMQLLQAHVNFCAKSYPFDNQTTISSIFSVLPADRAYVFKPSGGAAGIGLYPSSSEGANTQQIAAHITSLRQNGKLPLHFQIQEFIPGKVYGSSACFTANGDYEILEIHEQQIDQQGRCTGSRWTPEITSSNLDLVNDFYQNISTIENLHTGGLICLDFIQNKVIEVNPRIIASSPIAHILRLINFFKRNLGETFHIHQIDINTRVNVPYEMVKNGEFWALIQEIWQKYKVLCLPQGINPYGSSRIIFVNDDSSSSSQKYLLSSIKNKLVLSQ